MTTITTVPFSKLVASDEINARGATKDGIDDLAASIAQRGLIQPLAVRPADGGRYEVIDGRRRHAALAKLVKGKTAGWTKASDVPVLVRNEDDAEALETSLVANTVRLPMHPVDQYEVFTRFAAQGRSDADIAARFGLSERTVRQQRALGALAPSIRKAWRSGQIEAKAAQAFCCNPDHAAQEAAWVKLKSQTKAYGGLSDYAVRREMEGEREPVSGVDATVMARYTAAGGTVAEDLFSDASYIDDAALLKRCEAEHRAEIIAPVRARLAGQGWAWIADADDLPGAWRYQWKRLDGGHLTPEQEARHEDLLDLIAEQEEGSPAQQALQAEMAAIEEAAALRDFTPQMRARAGVVIDVDRHGDGQIDVVYGVLRPSADGQTDIEDAVATQPRRNTFGDDDDDEPVTDWGQENVETDDETDYGDECGGCSTRAGRGSAPEDARKESGPFAISGALLETITTAQTEAVATIVAANPELAMRLAVAAIHTMSYNSPAKLSIDQEALAKPGTSCEFVKHWAAAQRATYGNIIQEFAGLVAASLSLREGHYVGQHAREGKRALVESLDGGKYLVWMREAFLADDYFKRATKDTALAAIAEIREAGHGTGLAPEDVLADMKKAELAAAAATAAKACGWLPPELRHPEYTIELAAAAPVAGGQPKAPARDQAA